MDAYTPDLNIENFAGFLPAKMLNFKCWIACENGCSTV